MNKYIAIGIGGFIGAILRYLIEISTPCFYCSTMFVNSVGSFGLAFMTALFLNLSSIPNWLKISITVGFFGSFTTFSTFSLEALELLENGNILFFFFYSGINLLLGLLFAAIALYIVNRLRKDKKGNLI